MADKEFVRHLNSLIRIDKRKRLKAPKLRAAIPGSSGVAEIGSELPTDLTEYLYVRHYGGGLTGNPVYKYSPDGSAPVLEGQAGGRGFLGIHGDDIYGGDLLGEDVFKNASNHISTGLSQALVATNSTHIIVQDDVFEIYRYLLDGTYVDDFALPIVFMGAQTHVANDTAIGFTYSHAVSDDRMALSDMTGTLLGSETYENISYQGLSAAAKDVIAFCDPDSGYTNYQFKVFNNLGTKIATYSLSTSTINAAIGGNLDAFGITSNRLYLFGRSTGTPKCMIYEHTLTMTGSDATSGSLGSLLYTIDTPQTNNNATALYQSTAMDGALFA